MHTSLGQSSGTQSGPVVSHPVDEAGAHAEERLKEAVERVAFHRAEVERWERLGRAAAASLLELRNPADLPIVTGDDFFSAASIADSVVAAGAPAR